MEHNYEKNIKCPYCDHEHEDSWEYDLDDSEENIIECGSCGKEFNVQKNIEVTYSTTRINCEEKNMPHDYQFEYVFVSKQRHDRNIGWIDLSEHEWVYNRVMMCSICGDKEFIKITKDEYEATISSSDYIDRK